VEGWGWVGVGGGELEAGAGGEVELWVGPRASTAGARPPQTGAALPIMRRVAYGRAFVTT
jgi:hypothetical protein